MRARNKRRRPLRSLRPEGLKDIYRRRLLDTHPDRARILGCSPEELHGRTLAVNEAYELLQRAIQAKWAALDSVDDTTFAARRADRSVEPIRYTGSVPARPLRLGEYLYYRGVISWQELIEALCAQRRRRPLLGQLAIRLRFLTREDVAHIRRRQSPHEKFGETAVRLGLITHGQLAILLGRQLGLGHRFGHYLAQNGVLSQARIDQLVEDHRRHTRQHGTR
jgi:hypothetical protein